MKISRSRVVNGLDAEIGAGGECIEITETVELDEGDMEQIIERLVQGNLLHSMSERAVWERLKELGTVIERREEQTGVTC